MPSLSQPLRKGAEQTAPEPSRPIPMVFFWEGVPVGVLRHADTPELAELGRNLDGKRTTGAFDGLTKASEADKNVGRERNRPGFSKSGLASHSGTSRIGPPCPYKKSQKAPGESPLDVPGWSCGSSSLNTMLTSSLRILLFRVTAPKSADSRECVLPAWLWVLAPCPPRPQTTIGRVARGLERRRCNLRQCEVPCLIPEQTLRQAKVAFV